MRNQPYELKSKWRKSNGKLGVLLTRSKEKWRKKGDFWGCYIKFIASFHLCLSSSVFWCGSPLLSNDFLENIPKKNLNLTTFHAIWSCIAYNILRTVTALKISSYCWDCKRPVRLLFLFPICLLVFFVCLFCKHWRIASFSYSVLLCTYKWHGPYSNKKMRSESSLLHWNVNCVMISVTN